jgi:hypothetical protein
MQHTMGLLEIMGLMHFYIFVEDIKATGVLMLPQVLCFCVELLID